ncbi:MAG: sigma-70 family RNA polymerase sigma factor [Acidimicrobiales bacterium]
MESDDEFEEWYRRTRPLVVRVVTVACGGRAEIAAEATDEAMVRAFERWRRVREMGRPDRWAITVALNVARRRFRRQAHEGRLLSLGRQRVATPSFEGATADAISVWAVLDDLPPRTRELVALRYVADLGEAEIASLLDLSEGTVSAALSRARQRLRHALGSEDLP